MRFAKIQMTEWAGAAAGLAPGWPVPICAAPRASIAAGPIQGVGMGTCRQQQQLCRPAHDADRGMHVMVLVALLTDRRWWCWWWW
jgi:hypothetical protein